MELPVDFTRGKACWRPKRRPDVNTEVEGAGRIDMGILTTKSGELAEHVDDLLLVCGYAVTERN